MWTPANYLFYYLFIYFKYYFPILFLLFLFMFLSLTLAHHAPRIPSSTSCGSFRSSSLGPRFPLEQWKYRTERVVFGVQERSKRGRVLVDLCRLGLIFGAYWGYVATLAFFFLLRSSLCVLLSSCYCLLLCFFWQRLDTVNTSV
jgi:hypothetical protein